MNEARQKQGIDWSVLWRTEDWGAVWIGIFLLALCIAHALPFVQLPGSWGGDVGPVSETWPTYGIMGILGTVVFVYLINAVALYFQNENIKKYTAGFVGVIILSLVAYFIGKHDYLSHYGFNQVIWALVLGLIVSNFFAKLSSTSRPAWCCWAHASCSTSSCF
ncbi:MAG: hypothetical protein ACOC3Y_01395 [Desulfohalobiaceae bacterium]